MLFSDETIKRTEAMKQVWQKEVEEVYQKKLKFQLPKYETDSGISLKYIYTPEDVNKLDAEMPGQYPYTRGLRALTYQYAPWMIQLLHGFGTSEETRERTDYLLKEGMRGYGDNPVVLVDLDPSTHCGFDPDDPAVRGTVGLGGVTLHTQADLDSLVGGLDLTKTRVAVNTRFTCLPMLALYLDYASGRGYKPADLNGQSQNNPGSRWITTDIGGPTPQTQFKLRIELIKYVAQNMPRWNHTNLCGYVLGEMNASPAQELGMIMSEAIDLIEGEIKAGIHPDQFVGRFSSQVHLGMDFFEEIAKLRAWRRMWAKIMKERYGCKDPRSLQYRIHVHTGGASLTLQQPLNNIVRATLQVLACVLGGAQSLHACSYDEAIGLPSEDAVRTAIRINQVIQHETKIPYVTDPLGGSYYLEWLTEKVEDEAGKVLADIESQGGYNRVVENGWLRRVLETQSIKWRQEVDSGNRVVVGVNRFKSTEEAEIPPFSIDVEESEKRAIEKIKQWRANRDNQKVKDSIKIIKQTMATFDKVEKAGILMPVLLEAAHNKCTLAEMMNAILEVSGGRVYSGGYKK